jgi:hypothetical protein
MLLKNRAFLAALAGLLFLVAQAVFPNLPFTEAQVTAFIGLVAAYVVGEGLEGFRIIENLGSLLKSRKLWALVAGLIVVTFQAYNPNFAVTPDQLTELFVLLGSVIVGSGLDGPKVINALRG